jgi:osmoprotectant transport system substrate-binding protein
MKRPIKSFLKINALIFIIILFSLSFMSCGNGEEENTDNGNQEKETDKKDIPIVVASKIDTEGSLLGQMIVIMLRENEYKVNDKTSFGNTYIVREAIKKRQIDIYPEYTGNGAFFFPERAEPEVWKDFERAYLKVRELDREVNDIRWLKPANANNTWAVATREKLAQNEDIHTMEDFARYVNNGGKVKLACSSEFVTRPDALPAFQEGYGFELEEDQLLILSGGNTAQTEKALANATDGVNFAMAYGTDGSIGALNLTVLEDTKHIQPIYAPAPIVREEIFKLYPEINKILNPVFDSLNLETLQDLNGKIAVEGIEPSKVARDYLKKEGFIKN